MRRMYRSTHIPEDFFHVGQLARMPTREQEQNCAGDYNNEELVREARRDRIANSELIRRSGQRRPILRLPWPHMLMTRNGRPPIRNDSPLARTARETALIYGASCLNKKTYI